MATKKQVIPTLRYFLECEARHEVVPFSKFSHIFRLNEIISKVEFFESDAQIYAKIIFENAMTKSIVKVDMAS